MSLDYSLGSVVPNYKQTQEFLILTSGATVLDQTTTTATLAYARPVMQKIPRIVGERCWVRSAIILALTLPMDDEVLDGDLYSCTSIQNIS